MKNKAGLLVYLQQELVKLPVTPITGHVDLPVCWACDSDADFYNYHHVVPEAYGGSNGPQVKICSTCHDRLHELACKLYNHPEVRDSNPKLNYLTMVVVCARILAETSDNKHIRFSCVFKPETAKQVKRLKKLLNFSNQEEVVLYAIAKLDRELFKP